MVGGLELGGVGSVGSSDCYWEFATTTSAADMGSKPMVELGVEWGLSAYWAAGRSCLHRQTARVVCEILPGAHVANVCAKLKGRDLVGYLPNEG